MGQRAQHLLRKTFLPLLMCLAMIACGCEKRAEQPATTTPATGPSGLPTVASLVPAATVAMPPQVEAAPVASTKPAADVDAEDLDELALGF